MHTPPTAARACPACTGQAHALVLESGDPLHAVPGRYALVRCLDCGLWYVRQPPTPAHLRQHYPEDYAPHAVAAEPGARGWHGTLGNALLRTDYGYPPQPVGRWTRALAHVARRVLSRRETQRWLPFRVGGRLLDVGCGAGRFLLQMRALGWHVEGLETSSDVAAALAARTGLRIHQGTLPHADLAPASFHAVTLWAALEHLDDPLAALHEVYELLEPGGLVALTVPNVDSWSFRTFGAHWFGLDLPRHLTHFSPATLLRLVERAGFREVRITHVGRASWIRASARLARAAGVADPALRRFLRRGASRRAARRSERAGEADSLRLQATRP